MTETSPGGVPLKKCQNFAKFTEKHQCWDLFFNKVAILQHATLLQRDSDTGVSL